MSFFLDIRTPIPVGGSIGETVLTIAIAGVVIFLVILLRVWLAKNTAEGGRATAFVIGSLFLLGGLVATRIALVGVSDGQGQFAILAGASILVGALIFVASDFAVPGVTVCTVGGVALLIKPLFIPTDVQLGYFQGQHLFYVGAGATLVLFLVVLAVVKHRKRLSIKKEPRDGLHQNNHTPRVDGRNG